MGNDPVTYFNNLLEEPCLFFLVEPGGSFWAQGTYKVVTLTRMVFAFIKMSLVMFMLV